MPFTSAYLGCLKCGSALKVTSKRDVTRKKFCSHSCRQKWRYENGEFTWLERFTKSGTSPEVNLKKSRKGSLNGRWLGDRKKLRRPMCSYEGNCWRKAVYERDCYTCQHCKKRGGRLQAHHILPYSTHPESRFDVNNGLTLCLECHKKTDSFGWKIINIKKQK